MVLLHILLQVIDYDKYTINDDRVDMEIIYAVDPHPISPHGEHHFGYQILKSTILQIWGYSEVVVAPGKRQSCRNMIFPANTKHLYNICTKTAQHL